MTIVKVRLAASAVGTVLAFAQAVAIAADGAAADQQLPEVRVQASGVTSPAEKPYAGGQVTRGGSLGILGTADVMDTPFSTNNYSSELLRNQQARTLADVVVNDASVRMLTSTTGFGEDFQIRGFPVTSGDVGLNGFYGLVSASRVPVEIAERVEVLKGPGSLINGIAPNGGIGGGINVVTKRAADAALTRLTPTFVSKSQFGAHLDLGRRFGQDNVWGVRVNGVWRDGETTIDNGSHLVGLAAIALDYRGQRLRFSVDAFTQREDIEELRPQIGVRVGATAVPPPPSSRTNWYPGNPLELRDSTIASRLEFDLNDSLTAYAGIGYRKGWADQVFPQTFPPATAGVDLLGNFTVRGTYFDSYTRTTSTDAGVRARFHTAGIRHLLTIGVSRLEQESGNVFVPGNVVVPSNIYNPAPLPAVGFPRLEPSKASHQRLSSIAAADTMHFFDDRLLLTLGVRDQTVGLDSFNPAGQQTAHYKASAVSPLFGIVYKPIQNVSLYGNYTEGLTRGQIVGPGFANVGAVLPPFKSTQREVGVKADWGTVITTATVFEIDRPNAQADPISNVFGFDGEQRNRGLELTAYGEVLPGLRGMASAVFYDATLSRTAGGVNQGNDAPGVPDQTFSLGVEWDTPGIPGLSVNGRVIYTSDMFFNAANTVSIPGWTRYDIGARYATQVGGKPVTFRANIENLFDKNAWLLSGTFLTVSAGRTLVLSAAIDF